MRKIKKPRISDYLFCSRWSDADPNDPWCVGFVEKILIDKKGTYVELDCKGCPLKWWPQFWRITYDEGKFIVTYPYRDFQNTSIRYMVKLFNEGKIKC